MSGIGDLNQSLLKQKTPLHRLNKVNNLTYNKTNRSVYFKIVKSETNVMLIIPQKKKKCWQLPGTEDNGKMLNSRAKMILIFQ